MKKIGCLFMIICVVLAVVAIRSFMSDLPSKPSGAAPEPAAVKPKVTPAPTPKAPQTPAVEQTGPTLDQQMTTAQSVVATAKKALDSAKAACLANLAKDAKYKRAVDDATYAESQVKKHREPPSDPVLLASASKKWIESKSAKLKMEADALDTDAGIAAAVKNLTTANEQVNANQMKIDDVRREEEEKMLAENQKAAAAIKKKADAKKLLEMLVERGVVSSYDKDGNVRVDPLTWMASKRDAKEMLMRMVRSAYVELGFPPYFKVMSDRNDTEFGSMSSTGRVTIRL